MGSTTEQEIKWGTSSAVAGHKRTERITEPTGRGTKSRKDGIAAWKMKIHVTSEKKTSELDNVRMGQRGGKHVKETGKAPKLQTVRHKN